MDKIQLKLAEIRGMWKGFELARNFLKIVNHEPHPVFAVHTKSKDLPDWSDVMYAIQEEKKKIFEADTAPLTSEERDQLHQFASSFENWPDWKQKLAKQVSEKARQDAENMRYDD